MTTQIKAGLLAVAFMATLAAGAWLGHTVTENKWLARDRQAQSQAAIGRDREIAAQSAALPVREATRERLTAETRAKMINRKERYDHDPATRAWVDSPCPDGELECLR